MLILQYVFMCITLFHVVQFILDTLLMKRNSVNCVRIPLIQKYMQDYIQIKRACHDGDINFGL